VLLLSCEKAGHLVDKLHDRQLDVQCPLETVHDLESVSNRCLPKDSCAVVKHAHLHCRCTETLLEVNHGGVAIMAIPGVHLVAVDAARAESISSSVIVVVLY